MRPHLALALLSLGPLSAVAVAQVDGRVYRIKNQLTDKVLVPDEAGTMLVQGTVKVKDTSSHWKLVKAEDSNHYVVVNVASGKALTAPSKDSKAQIALAELGKNDKPKLGQLWSFEKQDPGFTIESRRSGLYLDVKGLEKEDGVHVIQYELKNKGGRANQTWELVPLVAK